MPPRNSGQRSLQIPSGQALYKGEVRKIGSMVCHLIPAEAGIQDSQGDINILDSGDPVPAKAWIRSDAQTEIFSQLQGDQRGIWSTGLQRKPLS